MATKRHEKAQNGVPGFEQKVTKGTKKRGGHEKAVGTGHQREGSCNCGAVRGSSWLMVAELMVD